MTAVRSKEVMDSVERKKLHLHVADLRKDAQRLRKLIELTRPTQIPSLSKLVRTYGFKCYFLPALDLFRGRVNTHADFSNLFINRLNTFVFVFLGISRSKTSLKRHYLYLEQ